MRLGQVELSVSHFRVATIAGAAIYRQVEAEN